MRLPKTRGKMKVEAQQGAFCKTVKGWNEKVNGSFRPSKDIWNHMPEDSPERYAPILTEEHE